MWMKRFTHIFHIIRFMQMLQTASGIRVVYTTWLTVLVGRLGQSLTAMTTRSLCWWSASCTSFTSYGSSTPFTDVSQRSIHRRRVFHMLSNRSLIAFICEASCSLFSNRLQVARCSAIECIVLWVSWLYYIIEKQLQKWQTAWMFLSICISWLPRPVSDSYDSYD